MKLVVCKHESEWVEAINHWLEKRIEKFKSKRLFLPAGETPRPLYRSWAEHPPKFLKELTLVQLDEILTGAGKNSFRHFFLENLPSYLSQFEFIESAESGADLAILGLGTNGHVAFHEPGLAKDFYSGCLQLNVETTKRLQIEADACAITYGLGAFLKTKAILIVVRGQNKREILQKILETDCVLPAAQLLIHRDVTIITDFKL